jgi:hypothetical protein
MTPEGRLRKTRTLELRMSQGGKLHLSDFGNPKMPAVAENCHYQCVHASCEAERFGPKMGKFAKTRLHERLGNESLFVERRASDNSSSRAVGCSESE